MAYTQSQAARIALNTLQAIEHRDRDAAMQRAREVGLLDILTPAQVTELDAADLRWLAALQLRALMDAA